MADLFKISSPLHVYANGEQIDTLFVDEVIEGEMIEYGGQKCVVQFNSKGGFYVEIGSAPVIGTDEYWKQKEVELLSMLLTGPLNEVAPKFQALVAKHIQFERDNHSFEHQIERFSKRSMAADRVISRLRTICLAHGMDAIDEVIKNEWNGEGHEQKS
jgi:hypothetical protein